MTDQQQHLKSAIQQQGELLNEIQTLQNQVAAKRELAAQSQQSTSVQDTTQKWQNWWPKWFPYSSARLGSPKQPYRALPPQQLLMH